MESPEALPASPGDPPATPSIKPIDCPACGGTLVLTGKYTEVCGGCGAEVVIPPETVKNFTVRRKFLETKLEASELHSLVDSPPSPLELSLAATGPLQMLLLLFLVTILIFYGSRVYINPGYRVLYKFLWGSDLVDTATPWALTFFRVVPPLVLFSPVLLVPFLTRRRLAAQQALFASLRLALPTSPGGPSTCRNCGAPLEVKSTEVVVPCPYCETENLVSLPEEWSGATASLVGKNEANISEAQFLYCVESQFGNFLLGALLFLVIPLFTILYQRAQDIEVSHWPNDWGRRVRSRVYTLGPKNGTAGLLIGGETFIPCEKGESPPYFLAVKRGETLVFKAPPASGIQAVEIFKPLKSVLYRRDTPYFSQPFLPLGKKHLDSWPETLIEKYGLLQGRGNLSKGEEFSYPVPLSGWIGFRFLLQPGLKEGKIGFSLKGG